MTLKHLGNIFALQRLLLRKNLYICSIGGFIPVDRHIFDESVLAFILDWKSGKFHNYCEVSNSLVTPYCIVFGVFCPVLNTSVGFVYSQ